MAWKETWADNVDEVHDDDLNTLAALVNHSPYDLSYVQTLGTRAVGYGEQAMGMKFQRDVTLTSVTYRCETADSDGNLVVELRKNGSQVSGTSKTIVHDNQVAGGTNTGTWPFAAGDILTVYIAGVGTSPGDGLVADITGALT